MNLSKNIFTLVRNAINLNHASIIDEDDNYLFVDDKTAGIFYIVVKKYQDNLIDLIDESIKYEPTISVISEERLPISFAHNFKCFRETYQYSYVGEKLKVECPYEITELTIDDYPYLSAHYYRNGDDEQYLKACINRGMLKVTDKGQTIGFVGEHPEYALGLLFVDENYRRQGIGKVLEKAMINKVLEEKRVPIEHVVITNENSKKLQASIPDMQMDKGFVYWYF